MRPYVILFFLGLLISYTGLHATVIALAYSQSDIYAAADSRIKRSGNYFDDICKINQVGDWFIVKTGLFETVPNSDNMISRIASGLSQGIDARESMRKLRPIFEREFQQLLESNKRKHPNMYYDFIKNRKNISNVILFRIEDRTPIIEKTFWTLRIDNNGNPVVKGHNEIVPLPLNKGAYEWLVIGQADAIQASIKKRFIKTETLNRDPAGFIRSLILTQIKSKPSSEISQGVGGPIDILHLSHDNVEWIQRKSNCK